MNWITFEIPGKAVPWHRPGQRGWMRFTHSEDRKWQGFVKLYAIAVRPHALPIGPVMLQLEFILDRPKYLPKKISYHIKKPDTDNLAKNIKDALTGSIYRDDSQVFKLTVEKRYCIAGEKPRVKIMALYL